MKQHIALQLLGVLVLRQGISLEVRTPRVAIIGSGIGGASASHFLTELFNGSVTIDLYEARAIGGRLRTFRIDEDEVEAAGSFIHPKNMYMQRFVKFLGLETISFSDRNIGMWNGHNFVSLNHSLLKIMLIIYHIYGNGLYNLQRHVDNMIKYFLKIYDLQDAGQSFTSVSALLSAMNQDFPKRLQTSTRNFLLNMNFTEKMINELVQAATVANYGQEVDIHSFVGILSVTALSSPLWSVKDGNKMIPQLLINRNKNVSVIQSRVTKIRNLGNSQYEVTHVNKGSTDPVTSNYDIVIIASPLTSDQKFLIEFVGFPDKLVFPGNYQKMHVTFVKADLNLKYFGLEETLDGIFSCNPNKTKISLICKANSIDGSIKENSRIWKIFSRKYMDRSLIDNMFSNITYVIEISLNAYPCYSTNLNSDNFKLHDALYHVNAIEWAASTMEMSAIAARNVAILAYKDFLRKPYDSMSKMKDSENPTKNIRTSGEL